MRSSRTFLFQLAEPGALTERQWRLLTGVCFAVAVDPITEGLFVKAEFTSHRGDGPIWGLDHRPGRLLP